MAVRYVGLLGMWWVDIEEVEIKMDGWPLGMLFEEGDRWMYGCGVLMLKRCGGGGMKYTTTLSESRPAESTQTPRNPSKPLKTHTHPRGGS